MPPLIVHVVYRLAVGGLENGVVNLINRLPRAILAPHGRVADRRRRRLRRAHLPRRRALHRAAQGSGSRGPALPEAVALLRELEAGHRAHAQSRRARSRAAGLGRRRPGARPRRARPRRRRPRRLERALPAGAAPVPSLRDALRGAVARSRTLPARARRRAGRRGSSRSTTASTPRAFVPRRADAPRSTAARSEGADYWLVGTVGRMEAVKDQTNLARAFVAALTARPGSPRAHAARAGRRRPAAKRSRGDPRAPACATSRGSPASGPTCAAICRVSIASCCRRSPKACRTRSWRRWRADCRSSRRGVGANAELVERGRDRPHGAAGRQRGAGARNRRLLRGTTARAAAWTGRAAARVERGFSLERMVERYHRLYTGLLSNARRPNARARRLPRHVRARDG